MNNNKGNKNSNTSKHSVEKGIIKPINNNTFVQAESYLDENFDLRYNKVSTQFEAKRKKEKVYHELNENSLFRELQKAGIKISLANLISLLKSDFVHQYDPFREYFENLPKWDGSDYINQLGAFVKVYDKTSWQTQLKKHLVRSVACALEEHFFNKQALILVHSKQNSGKSTFCRYLTPNKLQPYLAEDVTTDKDSRILLAKNFMINLDELAMMGRKDINSLKALLSKVQINERLPYDRKNTILPRRASFVGSTNQVEFLNDETGTVRWLCFELSEIDWNYSKVINMDDVYSQAYHLYKLWKQDKFPIELTSKEIQENELRNRKFQVLSVERELIERYFQPDPEKEILWTATEIMERVNNLSDRVHKLNKINIGKALKSLNYPEGRGGFSGYSHGYFAKLLKH